MCISFLLAAKRRLTLRQINLRYQSQEISHLLLLVYTLQATLECKLHFKSSLEILNLFRIRNFYSGTQIFVILSNNFSYQNQFQRT